MHPRSKHWHLIDFVTTGPSDIQDVHIIRVLRGAECNTEHRLIRSVMQLKIRPRFMTQGSKEALKQWSFQGLILTMLLLKVCIIIACNAALILRTGYIAALVVWIMFEKCYDTSGPRYHNTDASFSTVGEQIKCVVNLPYLETGLSSTCSNWWQIKKLHTSSIKKFWTVLWSCTSKQELVHLYKGLSVQNAYSLFCVVLNPGVHIELMYELLKYSTSTLFNAFSVCHGVIEHLMLVFTSIAAAETLRLLWYSNSSGGLVKLSGCPKTFSQRGSYMGNFRKACAMMKDRNNVSKTTRK